MAGGRGGEKRTSPPSWMQSEGSGDHEHWKEIFWIERYGHGKAGEHKTAPWSCETPTKLEEEASVISPFDVKRFEGRDGSEGCSGHSDSPIQLGRRGQEIGCFGGQKSTGFEEQKSLFWPNKTAQLLSPEEERERLLLITLHF